MKQFELYKGEQKLSPLVRELPQNVVGVFKVTIKNQFEEILGMVCQGGNNG